MKWEEPLHPVTTEIFHEYIFLMEEIFDMLE